MVVIWAKRLEEVTFRAAKLVGWSLHRMRANDFITLQYRHDAEFFDATREGDEIEIVSRLIEVRRVRGTWIHEIRQSGTDKLLMRDYSTGAFLDWNGEVRAAPVEMMEVLIRGEPAHECRPLSAFRRSVLQSLLS
jgi:acyl-CoA thioesterase FadM